MDKPRIIIADDDFNYIVPLFSKFIYEFFDEIDLEVITDPLVFEEMFTSLQKLDVLIIGKDFYNEDLTKHEIAGIFLLTEEQGDSLIISEKVHVLYKYTNVKGIFLNIVGESGLKVPMQRQTKDPEIIVVTSASGGQGKTTVALGMATALSEMYKRVLYIEASRLQTFQYYLKDQAPILKQDIYIKLAHAQRGIYQEIKSEFRTERFTYMPPLKASLMSYGIDFDMFGKVAKSAKESGEFDYVILDADCTFDESKTKMLSAADHVMIVTEQTPKAVFATDLFVKNISNIDADKYLFICNRYSSQKNNVFSENSALGFKIDEYVNEMEDHNQKSCQDIAEEESIRKIAFLLI